MRRSQAGLLSSRGLDAFGPSVVPSAFHRLGQSLGSCSPAEHGPVGALCLATEITEGIGCW